MPKKIDLAKEADRSNAAREEEPKITEELLFEVCPKHMRAAFKKLKTPAQRADFLFNLDRGELKVARDAHKVLDNFYNKLEAWFVQQFGDTTQTGVAGKVGRVELKRKEFAIVEDWPKFYANIKKKGEFDLLNKAVNQRSIKERWDSGKQVPGVGKFIKKVISLTAVRGNK